jgi:integrase/recombinase XerC
LQHEQRHLSSIRFWFLIGFLVSQSTEEEVVNFLSRIMPIRLSKALSIVNKLQGARGKKVAWYNTPVKSLIDFVGDVPVTAVSHADIQNWYTHIGTKENERVDGRHLSAYTVDSYSRAIRAFFNHLVDMSHLDKSPCENMRLPKLPRMNAKDLTEADYKLLLQNVLTIRDEAIVRVLWDTGARLNAVSGMTIKGLNLTDGSITAFDEKIDEWLWLFFSTPTGEAINRYLFTRPSMLPLDALWLTGKGKQLKPGGVAQVVERAAGRAGIHATPHMFRHSKTKRLVAAGTPHKVIQDLMGWKSEAMVQHYVVHRPQELRAYSHRYDFVDLPF